jgi:hypothetical protein
MWRPLVAKAWLSHPVCMMQGMETLTIDCDECRLEGTAACDDCVVTFLLGSERSTAVVIDMAEARAVRLLGDAGLVPALRHVAKRR